MNPQFDAIFARLRAILEPQASQLEVRVNTPEHYCLDIPFSPKLRKRFPVAWVKASKAYVSFHFMPVYMFPELRETMSTKLRARMEGKSCFNFKVADEGLFTEREQFAKKGLAVARAAGF